MSAFADRRAEDLKKVCELANRSNGKLFIRDVRGNPPSSINLEFNLKTAGSASFPKDVRSSIVVEIGLAARYPFQEPSAKITSPIFHPNVYTSGQICFGTKWLPTEGLELLVRRIARIIIFDPAIVNEKSPANPAAKDWYIAAKRRFPEAFPTDAFDTPAAPEKKHIAWNNTSPPIPPFKTNVRCPQCGTLMALPVGRTGVVKCASCQNRFEAST